MKPQRLNTVMQMNLWFLILHCALYGSISQVLLNLQNPFADFLVVLAFTSLIGLWLCFDFLVPVLCEAIRHREKAIIKPIGGMMLLSMGAFLGGTSQVFAAI